MNTETKKNRTATTPSSQSKRKKQPTKLARILRQLVSGTALDMLKAEKIGDHCLHSTVSSLANGYGITIDRRWVSYENAYGTRTRIREYWLAKSSKERAVSLLSQWGIQV